MTYTNLSDRSVANSIPVGLCVCVCVCVCVCAYVCVCARVLVSGASAQKRGVMASIRREKREISGSNAGLN
jgi:hypothetical protein